MAQVTVSELAKTVGASVDRLLMQMKEAGLSHASGDAAVSDEEKQTLLAYLKGLHGESAREPKKITLQRKTLSTLKTGNRKTVNIEVRKKRTYVKRSDEEIQAPVEIEEAVHVEPVAVPVDVTPTPAEAAPAFVSSGIDDIEEKRQAATEARRRAEEEKNKTQEDALSQAEEEARLAAEAVAALKAEEAKKIAKPTPPPVLGDAVHEKGRRHGKALDDDDDSGKKVKKPLGKGGKKKTRLELNDVDDSTDKKPRLRSGNAAPFKIDNKHTFKKPTEKKVLDVQIPAQISVAELAQRMLSKAGVVVRQLMKMGVMASINEVIDQETAFLVVEELGHNPVAENQTTVEDSLAAEFEALRGIEEPRAPVVTVMGHVDHGKTSLLDYIRKTRVASGEAGGITQHIGAYHVNTPKGMITFLDTPGHAAFTAMRARGAKSTDVVILVVAADDGVMPQTEEAIQHARAAGVPLVVAINKMDKAGADPERVTSELGQKNVIPEEWGGDTQFIPVSAITGEGVESLLEAVLLQAELLELTAVHEGPARGVVVESELDKGRGPVATLLVQNGTLSRGDIIVAGEYYGRVRAINDEHNNQVKSAGPATPVAILGLGGTPAAGDPFLVAKDEKKAREVAEFRKEKATSERLATPAASLDTLLESFGASEINYLNVVVKADVRGSLEAIVSALRDLGNDEVKVNVVFSGVGGITESDVNLALTSGAVIFGFNVRADNSARKVVELEGLDLRYYKVIYDLVDDVKAALSGMLSPEVREDIVGIAEVRDVFESKKFGNIAGCMVIEGTVSRSKKIRVLRENVVIYEGELESLRHFKSEVEEAKNGTECGIGVKNYNDVKVKDQIEVFDTREVARVL